MQGAKALKRRIIVGDVHGELDGLKEILRHAGLIDVKDHWAGDGCILIQTGDVIDRGPFSREAVVLLRTLQQEAPGEGGKVVRLCGNHELMLLQGHFFYVNFEDPASLATELTEEIAKGNVRASYSDGAWLYSHAGLRSAIRQALMAEMGVIEAKVKARAGDLDRLAEHINGIFRQAVKKDDLERHPIFHVGPERGGDNDVGGIFWCDFSKIGPSLEAWTIPQIFGHTPTRQNRVQTAQGLKLIDVDAGMCRVYGGARVYLEITEEGDLLQHSKALSKWTVTPLAAQ